MNLEQLQRKMAKAVMQPLTSSEAMRSRSADGRSMRLVASEFIKPNDRLTSFERLEIYNRQYWFRILSALQEDFPGLQAVLGESRFDAMSKAYLADCPSRSFTLRNIGSRLVLWLRKHSAWLGPQKVLALDTARLEWAHVEAFDGAAAPVLRLEDLSSSASLDLRLQLQPHLQLLDVNYPVDDLVIALNKDDDEFEIMSNAVSGHRIHHAVRKIGRLRPKQLFLAVYRSREEDSVYYRRLEREEYILLTALREGKSVIRATALAMQKNALTPEQFAIKIQQWFSHWATLDWFCQPGPAQGPDTKS